MRPPRLPKPRIIEKNNEQHWQDQAVCVSVDPELFFPEPRDNPMPAVNICRTCPVKLPCLRAGLHEEYGVWGGLTSEQRKALRDRMEANKGRFRNQLLVQAAE